MAHNQRVNISNNTAAVYSASVEPFVLQIRRIIHE